jgi:SAM-dependent methyltransferase
MSLNPIIKKSLIVSLRFSNQNPKAHASSMGHNLASTDWIDIHFTAMQPEYEQMLSWVGIQPNWQVLDAGCGTGSYLPLMTELVGNAGKVSAVDLAPENIRVVEERAGQGRWFTPVDARVGSILDLPFADQSFDAVWCANTSQYLSDTELLTMLQEFRRIVRPGGLIAIKEYDITAQQVQPTMPMLFLHLHEALCRMGDQGFCNLFRTLNLPHWLREIGLIELRQNPTLIVRSQPLRPVEKKLVSGFIENYAGKAEQAALPAEELDLWRKLTELDAGDHIIHHPDFQYRCIQTVFVGRVPKEMPL